MDAPPAGEETVRPVVETPPLESIVVSIDGTEESSSENREEGIRVTLPATEPQELSEEAPATETDAPTLDHRQDPTPEMSWHVEHHAGRSTKSTSTIWSVADAVDYADTFIGRLTLRDATALATTCHVL
mmetsp:Transcript_17052/g.51799  ORF Transcript_17052/g.51799 Transcript_17052/m.51799 type:complete len:129 (+) Transcript_17052:226-612(+)